MSLVAAGAGTPLGEKEVLLWEGPVAVRGARLDWPETKEGEAQEEEGKEEKEERSDSLGREPGSGLAGNSCSKFSSGAVC